MTLALVWKLLRDLRVPLLVVVLLLAAFECLWAKITQRVTEELVPSFTRHVPIFFIKSVLFEGPGKLMQTLMGGDSVDFTRSLDMLSIGYVHPLVAAILCVWAVGRAAGAIAGEIDRGTMELLLAQPLARWRVVLAHFCVDVVTIPLLCLGMWGGNWLGIAVFGQITLGTDGGGSQLRIDPRVFLPALVCVAALLFSVSGLTMWLSAGGRFRGRVLGGAVLLILVQFLVNVIGQLWPAVEPLRKLTVFYYYAPQNVLLKQTWMVRFAFPWSAEGPAFLVNGTLVLVGVGTVGYLLALGTFCRRDVPAPL